jgi:hypothetical protein
MRSRLVTPSNAAAGWIEAVTALDESLPQRVPLATPESLANECSLARLKWRLLCAARVATYA